MKSVFFAYSHAIRRAADLGGLSDIDANDYVVATAKGVAEAHEADFDIEAKLLRYLDYWSAGYFTVAESSVPRWAPGPGDVYSNLPRIKALNAYPYRLDQFYDLLFLRWCVNVMEQHPDQAGLFLDDWTPHVDYYRVSEADKRIVWPDWKPGDWREEQMAHVETWAHALASLRDQRVVVNGRGRRHCQRLHESVGEWISPEQLRREAKVNDFVLVKGLKADGETWAETSNIHGGYSAGTSFKDVFKDVLDMGEELGLYVGLAYAETPAHGGSTMNYHAYTNPKSWESL